MEEEENEHRKIRWNNKGYLKKGREIWERKLTGRTNERKNS